MGQFHISWFVSKNVYHDPKTRMMRGVCWCVHPRPPQPKSGQTKTQTNKIQDGISILCFPHVFRLWCFVHSENSDFDSFLFKVGHFLKDRIFLSKLNIKQLWLEMDLGLQCPVRSCPLPAPTAHPASKQISPTFLGMEMARIENNNLEIEFRPPRGRILEILICWGWVCTPSEGCFSDVRGPKIPKILTTPEKYIF